MYWLTVSFIISLDLAVLEGVVIFVLLKDRKMLLDFLQRPTQTSSKWSEKRHETGKA